MDSNETGCRVCSDSPHSCMVTDVNGTRCNCMDCESCGNQMQYTGHDVGSHYEVVDFWCMAEDCDKYEFADMEK